jgi:hypothetical protein
MRVKTKNGASGWTRETEEQELRQYFRAAAVAQTGDHIKYAELAGDPSEKGPACAAGVVTLRHWVEEPAPANVTELLLSKYGAVAVEIHAKLVMNVLGWGQVADGYHVVRAHAGAARLHYAAYVRTRSDNILWEPLDRYAREDMLRYVVPAGAFVPACRSQLGVNDKLAILGELAAPRYFLVVEYHLSRWAQNVGTDYINPELEVARSLKEGSVCIWTATWHVSHALWVPSSRSYCHRSFEECVPHDIQDKLFNSKVTCPRKNWQDAETGAAKKVAKAREYYLRGGPLHTAAQPE